MPTIIRIKPHAPDNGVASRRDKARSVEPIVPGLAASPIPRPAWSLRLLNRWCGRVSRWPLWWIKLKSCTVAHAGGFAATAERKRRSSFCSDCRHCVLSHEVAAEELAAAAAQYLSQSTDEFAGVARILHLSARVIIRGVRWYALRCARPIAYCQGGNDGRGCGCGRTRIARLRWKRALKNWGCPEGHF